MKFNKSAESAFWYVGFDNDNAAGKIEVFRDQIVFESGLYYRRLTTKEMREITEFMENIERESGIDTTSTFKSNSQ